MDKLSKHLLLDTDVLIDYLRGNTLAVKYLEGLKTNSLHLSVITIAELFAGVKGEKEKKILEDFIRIFEIIPINEAIARQGGLFRNQYLSSHGTGLADAIIAATADIHHLTLVTLNKRHFPMLETTAHAPYKKS